ncbi:MAG: hypothetical protein ACKVI6_00160 [Candidatus Poseidoniales archaeon]|jgi:hypothetical protein|tara:strand:+ start:913 stop:1149 length:237 start_codon:yes stop_codon:yes gene_type:complete
MDDQNIVAWICSTIVFILIIYILIYEMIKRWQVELRLSALDESLLDDDYVLVEEITDAPSGSKIITEVPAYLIVEDES